MNTLKVRNLCKTYIVNKQQNHVLRNVNLEVKQGEMVAVMGPSGSGKTTLLYTVSGMDTMTAGEVDFYGTSLKELDDEKISLLRLREMGFVFQQMYMLKNLSIYDNIILPAYEVPGNRNMRKSINESAVKLMNKLGISEVAEHDITEVSGGQLQRACICRSLINHPRIVFADEPTGALNQQASKEVMRILNQINEEGTSIMLVTHDLKVAARCEKVLYIEDGSIRDEFELGKFTSELHLKDREKLLNEWLLELGW